MTLPMTQTLEQTLKQAPEGALGDPRWRLNHLYKIRDKKGKLIPYRMNWAQRELYDRRWYRNLIPKARQLGCTTGIQIGKLDRCLFVPNTRAGVIAHTREAAENFFHRILKFAYNQLDPLIKDMVPCETNNRNMLEFANGSSISVGTSMRSGTFQLLHISEFGKMCATSPAQAEEIMTGTLNAIDTTGEVYIESTAEGAYGDFYRMVMESSQMDSLVKSGAMELTSMHYRLFFFPWWRHPEYTLAGQVPIDETLERYFRKLEGEHQIFLTEGQKNYYAMRAAEQGEKVSQEYPSFLEEAFYKNVRGAIFGKEITAAKRDGRVGRLPILPEKPVNVFWDLGRNDPTALWFQQRDGAWDNFIYYYASEQLDISHYIKVLEKVKKRLNIHYGTLFLPHDGKTRQFTSVAGTAKQILMGEGYRVRVSKRVPQKMQAIVKTRQAFPRARFHETNCAAGLKALTGYQFEWDPKNEAFRERPKRNFATHGADAFMEYGMMAQFLDTIKGDEAQTVEQGFGTYSRKQRLQQRSEAGAGYFI